MTKEKLEDTGSPLDLLSPNRELVLYNDDVNTFDFVISTLIEVCKHEPEQAEQCAFVAHSKGKCGIKNGEFSELKPLHSEMNNRGLITTIE